MKILLIRHGDAEDTSPGGDLARRLTAEGRAAARRVFRALAKRMEPPDVILCSDAVRARETADVLSACTGGARVVPTPLLNPGSCLSALRKAIERHGRGAECVAVVGHEPDLSEMLGQIVSDGRLRVRMKKLACAVVDMNRAGKGELQALIPPAVVEGRGRT